MNKSQVFLDLRASIPLRGDVTSISHREAKGPTDTVVVALSRNYSIRSQCSKATDVVFRLSLGPQRGDFCTLRVALITGKSN